jgi:hypothetical protein
MAWETLTRQFGAAEAEATDTSQRLTPEQLVATVEGRHFARQSQLRLDDTMLAGLAELFKRKRPYLVTLARQVPHGAPRGSLGMGGEGDGGAAGHG